MSQPGNMASALKNIRKRKEWTQMYCAEVMGIARSTLSKWESGESIPSASNIPLICHALGVSPNELMSFEVQDLADSTNDRLSHVLMAEGVEKASLVLSVPEEAWTAVIEGKLQVSAKSLAELASTYKVSLDWLRTGMPAAWTPSLDTGVSARLRFLRICAGMPMPDQKWAALEANESYANRNLAEAVERIEQHVARYAVSPEDLKDLKSRFPFDFKWVLSGEVNAEQESSK